jgi:hypothetical protein
MDLITSERRIKCREPVQEKPDPDTCKKITELFHSVDVLFNDGITRVK